MKPEAPSDGRGRVVLTDEAPLRDAVAAWSRHMNATVHPERLRARLCAGTIAGAIHAAANAAGQRAALEIEGDRVTHAELDDRVARMGGWLRDQGVQPGDSIVVAGRTSIELVTAYLGIVRARATMVPADPGSTAGELEHLVRDSGAVAAWASEPARERLAGVEGLRFVGGLEDGAGDTVAAAVASGPPLEVESLADDVVMLAYTSGTTGRPKGVPLTHTNLLSSLRGAMWAWHWSAGDIVVHALPLSHQHGLSGVQMALLSGSTAVLLARFDAERLCEAIERNHATIVLAVPAMYEQLAVSPNLARVGEGPRLWVSGSAPLSPDLSDGLAHLLGDRPLERYGSTETGLSVSNPYAGPRRSGSVGMPLPGLEMAVVDPEGEPVAPGKDGEIVLRGPQVFGGYWQRPDADAESFLPGGWFRTGDVGRIQPHDGDLRITGRLKEMILSGGLNVYPREVELVLEQHPTVRRAAVVGAPSQRWGEEVVAFVVAEPGTRPAGDALIAHAREQLSAFKCPKRVHVVAELPLTSTGKVRRGELAAMAADTTLEHHHQED